MNSKTYCAKHLRFGRFLPELRRGIQLRTLTSAGSSFYFQFFTISETFKNGNIALSVKIRGKFQFLPVKFWGLV